MSSAAPQPDPHAFFDAVRTGRLETLTNLLERAPELAAARDDSGLSAVRTALYYEQPAALELLLARRPELDLFDSAALGNTERPAELLDSGAFVDAQSPDGFTALQLAAHYGRDAAVELLLERGAGVRAVSGNPLRVTALHLAAAQGHVEVARALLDAGADPNARDQHEDTPLHAAARAGSALLLGLLHQHGADPAARNADSQTAEDVLTGVAYGESE